MAVEVAEKPAVGAESINREISGIRHLVLMLCASFMSVFLFAVGMGFPLVLSPFLALWILGLVGFAHFFTPLLFILYCPLTLKYWQSGRRGFLLFAITGLWVAALNGLGLGLLVQGGQFVRGADPFDLVEVFRVVPIYIICGLITGVLHWLFLTRAQRRLERGKIHDTP